MRIIGGNDYYDGAAGYDSDRSRVFNRNKLATCQDKKLAKKFNFMEWSANFDRYDQFHTVWVYYIVFGGKAYKGLHVSRRENYFARIPTAELTFTKAEIFQAYIEKFKLKLKGDPWPYDDRKYVNDKTIDEYFKPVNLYGDAFDYFADNQIMTALINRDYNSSWRIFENIDSLQDYGLAKVLDPYQAYQELDMFLGSVLVNDNDHMVKLDEKQVVAKHGFDKYSFRNQVHPSKPRGN